MKEEAIMNAFCSTTYVYDFVKNWIFLVCAMVMCKFV